MMADVPKESYFMIVELSVSSSSFPSGFFGLGDILATIYILENTGLQKGIEFRVFFDGAFDPTRAFVLNNVFGSEHQGADLIGMVAKRVSKDEERKGSFFGGFFIPSMLDFFVDRFGYDPDLSAPIKTVKKPAKSDFVAVQMDGRCAKVQGRDISLAKKKNIALKHKNFCLVGGKDTSSYLGGEFAYEKCEFERVVELVSSARLFVGTDSGISHLAGILGISSKIYALGNIRSVKNYYTRSYRNCSVIGFPFL